MSENAPGREHRELGMGRGARRGAEDRDVLALGRVHELVVEPGLARCAVAAHLCELARFHQPRIVVFSHAARIGIDDVLQVRRAVGQAQQLVDLFFVFGKRQPRFAIAEQIGGFLVQHIAVQAKAQATDGMRCNFRRHPVRPVVAHDADDIAAAEAHFDHAERKIVHARLVVVPGKDAPEPEILFAQRDFAAMLLGVETQELWIGVGLRDPAGVIHHAAHSGSGAAGLSSGSTRTSSSSPR